jgi:hypothetical protein
VGASGNRLVPPPCRRGLVTPSEEVASFVPLMASVRLDRLVARLPSLWLDRFAPPPSLEELSSNPGLDPVLQDAHVQAG